MITKPLVSIIVTTKNEEANLTDFFSGVRDQSYKNIEVIVVDNPSTYDRTREIARKFTHSVYVSGPERSQQRNFAASKSKGKYLLILDADMTLSRDVVAEGVEVFEDEKSIPVGGVVVPEVSLGKSYWAKVKAFERKINQGETFFEAARFFPKEIFSEFGGYDQELTGPEDWDLAQRVAKKYSIVRIKANLLHNEGATTLWGLAKRKYYYGLTAHRYLKKHHLSLISYRTVYFLRPAFYKNLNLLFLHPFLTVGLLIMLAFENVAGGLGYLVGRYQNG